MGSAVEGGPEQFCYDQDRPSFRHLSGQPGVELYRAHTTRYAFEPHTHEAFGIGTINRAAERFRYRGTHHIAPVDSLVLMNPDELHTGESTTDGGWQYRMINLEPQRLAALTGEADWWFEQAVCHDPQRACLLAQLLENLWYHDDPLAVDRSGIALIQLRSPLFE